MDVAVVVVVVADRDDAGTVVEVEVEVEVAIEVEDVEVVVAAIVTVIDDGAPDEMFVCVAEPAYDTANEVASAMELVPDEPAAIVDVAEIVHTVNDVCVTEIEEMLVKSKSLPSVVETVPQSICPDVAVSVNVNDVDDDVADDRAKTTVGAASAVGVATALPDALSFDTNAS